jgi:hypothetical protein
MAKSVSVIGIDPGELPWLRMLLFLLRHPDPLVSEMVRQTVLYLATNAHQQTEPRAEPLDHAG